LDETLEPKIKAKEVLTFGDNYVLFELPFMAEPPNLASAIFEMQTNGYKPILAHPERYGFWYKDFEKYREMKDKGVHLQLNMLSLIGHYSPETQKIAEKLVDEGLISFLGSDCHNQVHQEMIEIARTKPYMHKLIESGKLLNHTL
jgi:tyrosine-protein phosphatase YwqE